MATRGVTFEGMSWARRIIPKGRSCRETVIHAAGETVHGAMHELSWEVLSLSRQEVAEETQPRSS